MNIAKIIHVLILELIVILLQFSDYSREPTEPINVAILVGLVAGVVGLLLIVLTIVCLAWRGCCRKKLPKSDFETQAHVNPTYMTTKEVQEQTQLPETDIYYTLPGGGVRQASAGSRDSDLPDVVKLPLPEDDVAIGGVGPDVDNEHVVKPSEVVMRVGAQRTLSVKYNK